MARASWLWKIAGLAVVGVVLWGVVSTVGTGTPELLVLIVVLGGLAYWAKRSGISVPAIRSQSSLRRQDIIEPTNWSRTGKYSLRKSYGVALVVGSLFGVALSLAVRRFGLALLWIVAGLVGVVWLLTAWRFGRDIVDHRTETYSVRVPDLFSAHDFHIAVRQAVEDRGYKITRETSPGIGGEPASHNQGIFHAHGGFKGRRRPIADAKVLVPDLEDEPYLSDIVTWSTVGISALLVGVTTLVGIDSVLRFVVGPVFLMVGLAATVYDYYTRTREWGELYCVEEGTINASTARVYDDRTLDGLDSHADPTVTTEESSATLSVTVGAKSSSLYDQEELEADLDAVVEALEQAAAEMELDIVHDDGDA